MLLCTTTAPKPAPRAPFYPPPRPKPRGGARLTTWHFTFTSAPDPTPRDARAAAAKICKARPTRESPFGVTLFLSLLVNYDCPFEPASQPTQARSSSRLSTALAHHSASQHAAQLHTSFSPCLPRQVLLVFTSNDKYIWYIAYASRAMHEHNPHPPRRPGSVNWLGYQPLPTTARTRAMALATRQLRKALRTSKTTVVPTATSSLPVLSCPPRCPSRVQASGIIFFFPRPPLLPAVGVSRVVGRLKLIISFRNKHREKFIKLRVPRYSNRQSKPSLRHPSRSNAKSPPTTSSRETRDLDLLSHRFRP